MISIVIPVYNGEKTLKECLSGVFANQFKGFEVILVDDASPDKSLEIAEGFPCRIIKNPIRLGRGPARNAGLKAAGGEYVIFIDSDVLVKPRTIETILRVFSEHPGTAAVVGLPSADNPYLNFSSQFKSLYMHYILKENQRDIGFLHGCLMAIDRKIVFENHGLSFSNRRHGQDIELGLMMKKLNLKIMLSPEAEVIHLKFRNLCGLIKNDFLISAEFTDLILRHKLLFSSAGSGRFAHTSLKQAISVLNSFLALNLLFLAKTPLIWVILPLLIVYLILNAGLFRMVFKKKGPAFGVAAVLFYIFDQYLMSLGIIFGGVRFILSKGRGRSGTPRGSLNCCRLPCS